MTTKAQWRHRALAAEAEVASLTTALRDCREPRPKGIAVQGGFQALLADDQRRELDYLADAGCNWLRVGINHDSPSPGVAVALRARECGMKVLGVPSAAYPANVANAYELLAPFSGRHLARTTQEPEEA